MNAARGYDCQRHSLALYQEKAELENKQPTKGIDIKEEEMEELKKKLEDILDDKLSVLVSCSCSVDDLILNRNHRLTERNSSSLVCSNPYPGGAFYLQGVQNENHS